MDLSAVDRNLSFKQIFMFDGRRSGENHSDWLNLSAVRDWMRLDAESPDAHPSGGILAVRLSVSPQPITE